MFPENFIEIRLREGTFHNFATKPARDWSKYRNIDKFLKKILIKLDFDEFFRKCFFHRYYDPVSRWAPCAVNDHQIISIYSSLGVWD